MLFAFIAHTCERTAWMFDRGDRGAAREVDELPQLETLALA